MFLGTSVLRSSFTQINEARKMLFLLLIYLWSLVPRYLGSQEPRYRGPLVKIYKIISCLLFKLVEFIELVALEKGSDFEESSIE